MSPFVLLDTTDVDLEIEIEVDGYAITVEIAEDEEDGRKLFVDCLFKKRHGSLYPSWPTMDFWEFAFQIVLTDDWNGEAPIETMDRFMILPLLPPGGSSTVLDIAERCLGMFIEKFDPEIIYRVTNAPDLPEKGLRKHRRLTVAAERLGYMVVSEGRDDLGRRFWIMR